MQSWAAGWGWGEVRGRTGVQGKGGARHSGSSNVANPEVNKISPKQSAQIAQVSLYNTNMSHANYAWRCMQGCGIAWEDHAHLESLIKMSRALVLAGPGPGGERLVQERGGNSRLGETRKWSLFREGDEEHLKTLLRICLAAVNSVNKNMRTRNYRFKPLIQKTYSKKERKKLVE